MSTKSEPESSQENMLVRHNHSFSEFDRRSHIPMWDSADPDRAPPPLPLNPGSGSPVTRPTASATIQAAAAAIAEKAHDSTTSSYTTNPMPSKPSSPDKSLIKGQYHKRMQSFQNMSSNSRDFADYLERRSSPEKNSRTDRSNTGASDQEADKTVSSQRPSTPTPAPRDSPRPSSQYLSKPILGESTPPSATMLALQNMQVPVDIPVPSSNPATNPPANHPQKEQQSQDKDALSSQINSLTRIATSLQQEMTQLSRRSKDNATDLVSLKAATNARDEDIRKSLKELTSSLSSKLVENDSLTPKSGPYVHPGTGAFMIENREYNSSPTSRKGYTLPRIPSPNTFATSMERDLTASPAAVSTDGSANIALLEKVLRDMATKEGQEKLLQLVEDVKSRPVEKGADTAMSKMLEEILDLVKETSGSRALVRSQAGGGPGPAVQSPDGKLAVGTSPMGPLSRSSSMEPEEHDSEKSQAQPANRMNEETLQILKRVKNSVAVGGGLTNEVKALVRELRGEVLGMGRDIARKLEQAESNRLTADAIPQGPGREEIAEIVGGGLSELRHRMEHLIHQNRPRTPPEPSHPPLGGDDVYAVVKQALSEVPLPETPAPQVVGSGLEKDEILDAVREAWETYKPEIELQNFGLERDEILECLTDGLKAYQPQKEESAHPPASYEQVLDAVHYSLENWTPPRVEPDMSAMREATMAAVQECLESFEWPTPPPPPEERDGIGRDDVLNAVKDGLADRGKQSPDVDFTREDVYEAVRTGFHEASSALDNHVGEQVMEQFHGLATEMKDEFKQYSAANGRDTEQVLDAIKDGLEVLRTEVESYVDRAADVTGKDEIIDTVKEGFGLLHGDVERCIAETSRGKAPETVEMLDAMEKEFEHLRQTLSNLLIRNSVSSDKEEILDAIRDISEIDGSKGTGSNNPDLEKTVKEEFEHLRGTLSMMITKPDSPLDKDEIVAALKEEFDTMLDEYSRRKDGNESVLSNTSELLDAFHDGVDVLRADMEKVLEKSGDSGSNVEIMDSLKGGLSEVKAEIELLREHQKGADETQTARGRELMLGSDNSIGSDIESLKVLVTQLQIKVDAIGPQPAVPESDPNVLKKDDLLEVLEAIKEVQGVVGEVVPRNESAPSQAGAARKEDTDAIETLVRNTKTQLDEYIGTEGENKVTTGRLDALETLAKDTKDLFEGFTAHVESESPTKADVSNVETIMKDMWVAMDDLKTNLASDTKESSEKVGKEDVKNLEVLLFEMKSQLEEFVLPDPETLPTKDDIGALTTLVTEFREKVEMENDLTAEAFESRKIEHGGIAEKLDEAKTFITEIRDEFKERLGDGEESLMDLKTMIDCLNESANSFAKAESIKELSDLVTREFERSHGDREGAKMDAEERELGTMAKNDEGRAAAVAEVVAKLEEKFDEVIAKYDEAQEQLESNFTAVEDRDKEGLEALTSTKSLAEDIKLVIGGMGNSVTETCERMSDDARTFFGRVDESFAKVDDLHGDIKTQNEHVNGQFQKTLEATERLEQQMAGAHPEILDAIKEVVALVGKHYEHSQKTTSDLRTDLSAIPSAIQPLLPALPGPASPPPSLPDASAYEKYDDSKVQDKLDTLLGHATDASQSFSHMDKLERIQEQVAATARDVSEMMAAQSKSEDQESKRKEEQEIAIALEKRVAQREKVEGEVVALSGQREDLLQTVSSLRREKEELANQNTEMAKELARTETALRIRREEVEMMEGRAEGIERRIVEDVLDHARAMLINKPNGSEATSLKRVPSEASTVTRRSAASTTNESANAISSGVGMALKRQTSSRVNTAAGSTMSSSSNSNRGKGRRILSHSHVTGNRKPADRQTLQPSSNGSGGFGNLKRSHSVKSSYGLGARNPSWEPRLSLIANKENAVVQEEEDEDEENGSGGDVLSDAGTERRTSYTGTFDSLSYASAMSVTTDRRTSHGSTNALVSAEPGSWIENDDYSQAGTRSEIATDRDEDSMVQSAPGDDDEDMVEAQLASEMVLYGQHSDSGLGTDLHSPSVKEPAVA